jgi:ankyrin repeat protein
VLFLCLPLFFPFFCPSRSCSYVDVRTQTGFSAMHFAVHTNSQQCLAALLNLGANPLLSSLFDSLDTINCSKGTTALHLAARQGNEAIIKQLLRAYVSDMHASQSSSDAGEQCGKGNTLGGS